ncbi:hypothetical protein JCM19235_5541 [Vibrio maritimus]|uniref:Uncharacterized protein n=1 Tax=Vibrio maritimus TaxID=990268 RepID=A0A090SBT2_9VIBR|nr:hypothetical protein JCM19235_5541 [Vibrio maritimus]
MSEIEIFWGFYGAFYRFIAQKTANKQFVTRCFFYQLEMESMEVQ